MPIVVVVEDDPSASQVLAAVLRSRGYTPVVFDCAAAALTGLEQHDEIDAAVIDLLLPDMSGEELLLELRRRLPELPVIVLSAQESVSRAVEIMKLRPFDYFVKPFEHERLVRSLEAASRERELTQRVRRLEREVQDTFRFDQIVGQSAPMRRVYDQIEKVLNNRVPVFIHGQSGTGKELVAKAIHYHGPRRSGPFVALNCGAIAEGLQESELFGHEKGAFTGAVGLSRGRFEQAHRGTLFLDEVAELSPAVQTRLLRVLQEGTFQRLGGAQTVTVDVRVISATHRDLDAMVAAGSFRQDLYYRLVVFPMEIPPLRERPEDIPPLVSHFVRKHHKALGSAATTFAGDAMDILCRYDWPGNVRELENIVVRTLVSASGETSGIDALPPFLVMRAMGLGEATPAALAAPSEIIPLAQLEERAIRHAMQLLNGNVSLAARKLGLGRATLYRKLATLGLGGAGTE